MNDDNINSASTPPARPLLSQARSRKQAQASQLAEQAALRQQWRRALPLAGAAWTRLSTEELGKSDGNVHRLAGLIQLRYGTTREDADLQVATFMKEHVTAA